MAREVRPYLPTWEDRRYKKDLKRQSPRDRKAIQKDLARLVAALRTATNPLGKHLAPLRRPLPAASGRFA